MSADEFRRVGHALVDSLAAELESIPSRPVTPAESPGQVRALIDADRVVPERGTDALSLVDGVTEKLFDHSLFNGNPRFFGYITSSPAPIGMFGDLLAAAINPNVGAWILSPVATEIEAQAIRWIAQMIGYPEECGGLFVSGGNMANFVGFLAARAAAADWDIRARGMGDATAPLRIYASAETHTWIHKAADMAGLGTDAIRWIHTDRELRMDTAALRSAIETDRGAGDRPMMVVGTAGSVSTGAIDPLAEIAEICREEEIWFHVDGAYGAFAAVAPDAPSELEALRFADSVALDPHKWMYAPLEVGCILTRSADLLTDAFSYHPPYYHFEEQAINYFDLGPQNSRGFRALKVWLQIQHVGRDGYGEMVSEDMRLSRVLADAIRGEDELELWSQSLSITCFRYVPAGFEREAEGAEDYLNELNKALLEVIQASGEAFVSNAVVRGAYLLRACIVNFQTAEQDVWALGEIVTRLGRGAHERLRAAAAAG